MGYRAGEIYTWQLRITDDVPQIQLSMRRDAVRALGLMPTGPQVGMLGLEATQPGVLKAEDMNLSDNSDGSLAEVVHILAN